MWLSNQTTISVLACFTCSIACLFCTPFKDNGNDKETDDTDGQEPLDAFDTDAIVSKLDTFWGNSPEYLDRRWSFDSIWNSMASGYAGFAVSDVDWDDIRSRYRPAILNANSYGRFFQILSKIYNELHDGHTAITSAIVCGSGADPLNPPPDPRLSERPPLFILENRISYIGACVTVLDDDTLLVYKAAADNPAGE